MAPTGRTFVEFYTGEFFFMKISQGNSILVKSDRHNRHKTHENLPLSFLLGSKRASKTLCSKSHHIFCKALLPNIVPHRYVSASLRFSSNASQVGLVHLVYNSALVLAACCWSFLLNVVANLICTFSVSSQLSLLSTSKISSFLWGRKSAARRYCKKKSPRLLSTVFKIFRLLWDAYKK
jgi:hypothetical protein